MSIKKKLYLMGICLGIVIIVLTVNVVRKLQSDNKVGNDIIKENIMTRAEAFRLLSYLQFNKTQRDALTDHVTYQNEKMSGWYDSYVNAVFNMGLIDKNVTISPEDALTYGACKTLVDNLILKNPIYQKAYTNLSFQFTDAEKAMSVTEFLELFQALLTADGDRSKQIKEETLLVLGHKETEAGKDQMITDLGAYDYLDAKSYEKESFEAGSELIDRYMDKGIRAYVCDQELIYIIGITSERIVVHNVWIKTASGLKANIYVGGIDKSFVTISKLDNPIEKVVSDLTVENGKIVKIDVKPDMIKGKVLRIGENFIEIEGYGKITLEDTFKIYKIYGDLSMEPTASILVGYNNTDFVVSAGKISAALITESIKADKIRVLLKTTGYNGIYHESVEFTATSDFTISSKKSEKSFKKGQKVTILPGDKLLVDGRATIKPVSDNGRIELLSIERSYGHPKYRGSIEIAEDKDGLILVNELNMEEYLYAVVPSEMPTGFGLEALKVQAVCARSYAYRQLLSNSMSKYGAHVDDSASFQVYNNVAENDDSILAVKDTYGQAIKYKNEVISAFYYSTSCGHTTNPSSVWDGGQELPYLEGKLLLVKAKGDDVEAKSSSSKRYEDLSSEDNFRSFLTDSSIKTYDSEFSWYRWKVCMSIDNIKRVIDSRLKDRYLANPDLIQTLNGDTSSQKKPDYDSIPIDTVGDIKDIRVLKREKSGIVSEILIIGSKNTIKVTKDLNIRYLLAPIYDEVIRQDDSIVKNPRLLPSSFFILDKLEKDGDLTGYTISGGGYGHGIGMSQNAVKALVEAGMDYKKIIAYFYEGTELGLIYE